MNVLVFEYSMLLDTQKVICILLMEKPVANRSIFYLCILRNAQSNFLELLYAVLCC